jgi:apolipoprotein N-acyltransferase
MIEYIGYMLYNNKKENFTSESVGVTIIYIMFVFIFSFLCIYLSWTCNTLSNTSTALKVIYAFFAWFFGIFYLLFYFFYNYLGKRCGT